MNKTLIKGIKPHPPEADWTLKVESKQASRYYNKIPLFSGISSTYYFEFVRLRRTSQNRVSLINNLRDVPVRLWLTGMFFLVLFISCETDMNKIKVVTATDDTPDQIVNDMHTIYSDSGIVKYEMIATRTEKYSKPKNRTLLKDGFKVNFFRSKDSLISTLSADYGEMRIEENLIIARNNVIFTNFETKKTLKTEELYWDQKTKRIRTEKRFEIMGEESQLVGFGVDSDETFSDYEMHKVTGEYTIKDTAQ